MNYFLKQQSYIRKLEVGRFLLILTISILAIINLLKWREHLHSYAWKIGNVTLFVYCQVLCEIKSDSPSSCNTPHFPAPFPPNP